MNKLLMFPITVMFFLSVYTITNTGETYESSTENQSDVILPNGTAVDLPGFGSSNINLWVLGGSIALLGIAFAIAIGGGLEITIFGSTIQMSDYSVHVAFNALIFTGIWGALTGFNYEMVNSSWLTTLSWLGVTIMYVIGVVMQINQVSE